MEQPNQSPATQKDFEIGLVLAGAVSAGAYTAGVMDFLLDALEKWNNAKASGEDVPMHNVRIKVISGASAGGMTAAMTAVEIRRRATRQKREDKSIFYKAWVDMIDIKVLLDCDDLQGSRQQGTGKGSTRPVLSLLNSTVIDTIANEIISIKDAQWHPLPYVTDEIKLYLSLSNLRGIPYRFKLSGETGFPYEMTSHADYQYVEIHKSTPPEDWEKLKLAAIATGAFPIGLSARIIKRKRKEYEERLSKDGLDISSLLELGDDADFDFVAVDGGLLNNEPLELAKSALYAHDHDKNEHEEQNRQILKAAEVKKSSTEKAGSGNKETKTDEKEAEAKQQKELSKAIMLEKGRTVCKAIIMVDPFPNINQQTTNPKQEDISLMNILAPVLGAMRAQAMFKPDELAQGTSDEIFDRFLVAPIRHSPSDPNIMEDQPLASGFFGGFGGFMSYDFRRHDYYLGRRNCQQFLKYYFSLPEDLIRNNDVFSKGLREQFIVTPPEKEEKKERRYPLIPLLDNEEEPTAEWPHYKHDEFNTFKRLLSKRVGSLLTRIIPIIAFEKTLLFIIAVAAVGISLTHLYQYKHCGDFFRSCRDGFIYIRSFGFGVLELLLMIAAAAATIVLLTTYFIRAWVVNKIIALIIRYLKEFKVEIK